MSTSNALESPARRHLSSERSSTSPSIARECWHPRPDFWDRSADDRPLRLNLYGGGGCDVDVDSSGASQGSDMPCRAIDATLTIGHRRRAGKQTGQVQRPVPPPRG